MGKKSRPTLPAGPSGEPLTPVYLIGRDGSRHRHCSRRSLLQAVGSNFLIEHVGLQFEWLRSESERFLAENSSRVTLRVVRETRDWIVRDALGTPLDAMDFWEDREALRQESRLRDLSGRSWRWAMRLGYSHLGFFEPFHNGGPVPGTGRWRRGRSYRHPGTHSQNRDNCQIDAEAGEPPVRGKRRKLPSDWDDFYIRSQADRCWKRHRAQQRKGSGPRRSKDARDGRWLSSANFDETGGDGNRERHGGGGFFGDDRDEFF